MNANIANSANTAKKPRIKRGGLVRMKVSEDIESRLDRISGIYGMPPSTLAAMAIGQWIAQQERSLQMSETIGTKMVETMGDALTKELQQLGLFTKGQDKS